MNSYSKDTQSNLQQWERRAEWPLAAVALAFLVVYSVQVLARPRGDESRALWAVTWVVWGVFALDYLGRLCLASDRPRWFFRHVFELLIVALPLLRPLRLVRLVVLIGALQNAAGNAVRGRIAIYTVSGVILLVYLSSLAILDQERDQPGATINSFGRALWWSITTVTNVGNGDFYPATFTGRVIAVLLMLGGISLIGIVTASLASWIVERVSETETAALTATAAQIDELRNEIRALSLELRG
ncbi:MAG: potassium channel family protein [Mycobacterium sp.]